MIKIQNRLRFLRYDLNSLWNLTNIKTYSILSSSNKFDSQNNYKTNFFSLLQNNPNKVKSLLPIMKLKFNFYSTGHDNKRKMHLMDLPRILVPNFFELLKVRFKIAFNMKKVDPSFSFNEFSRGSLQAACTVSSILSRGDFDSLNNLVSPESIEKIKLNYEKLNGEQKDLISINQADVQLQVPYNFELVEGTRIFAKICLLFYVVPGIHETLLKLTTDPTLAPHLREKFEKDLVIADYRFIREYTKGSESNWFISELNHWAIKDYEEEFRR